MGYKNKLLNDILCALGAVGIIILSALLFLLLCGCSLFRHTTPIASGNQIVLNGKPLDSLDDFKGLANVKVSQKDGQTQLKLTQARGTPQWILSVWTWVGVGLVILGVLGLALQKTLSIPASACGRFIESGAIIGLSAWVTSAYGWIVAGVALVGVGIALWRWIKTHKAQIKAKLETLSEKATLK